MIITIELCACDACRLNARGHGWLATFEGGDMPQGVAIPLPFTAGAAPATVAADLMARFPGARVEYEQERRVCVNTYRAHLAQGNRAARRANRR
jgi:hypothetical protein